MPTRQRDTQRLLDFPTHGTPMVVNVCLAELSEQFMAFRFDLPHFGLLFGVQQGQFRNRFFQQIGWSLELTMIFDTFLIRSILVPCLMTIGGESVWWPTKRRLSSNVKKSEHMDERHEWLARCEYKM